MFDDYRYFDPLDDYAPTPPPAHFLRMLKEIDPNLTVAKNISTGRWILAELQDAKHEALSEVMGPDGKPFVKGTVRFRVAVEFGFAKYLDRRDIEEIKRWSARFHPEGNIGMRRQDEEFARAQQESAYQTHLEGLKERGEALKPLLAHRAAALGAPLASRENLAKLAKRAEAQAKKTRARFFRQVVPAALGATGDRR